MNAKERWREAWRDRRTQAVWLGRWATEEQLAAAAAIRARNGDPFPFAPLAWRLADWRARKP